MNPFFQRQLVQRVGDADHAPFGIKASLIMFEVRDQAQHTRCLIRIASIISGITVKQLHRFGIPEIAAVQLVHGAEQVGPAGSFYCPQNIRFKKRSGFMQRKLQKNRSDIAVDPFRTFKVSSQCSGCFA